MWAVTGILQARIFDFELFAAGVTEHALWRIECVVAGTVALLCLICLWETASLPLPSPMVKQSRVRLHTPEEHEKTSCSSCQASSEHFDAHLHNMRESYLDTHNVCCMTRKALWRAIQKCRSGHVICVFSLGGLDWLLLCLFNLSLCLAEHWCLSFRLENLEFSHHHLFSVEHVLASRLAQYYKAYSLRREKNNVAFLTERVSVNWRLVALCIRVYMYSE